MAGPGPMCGSAATGKMCAVSEEQQPAPWTGLPPAAGRLLVSAPALIQDAFNRTVVYLLEHDDAGTVGVVLNRPSHTPVGQVLPDWQDVVSEPAVVFGGGPVLPDGALCLGELSGDGPGVRPVTDGLATVDLDADVTTITALTTRLRVFAGHAGWAAGQLADERGAGAWYVVEGGPADVFDDDPRPLWRRVLRRQQHPLSMISTYPAELGLN